MMRRIAGIVALGVSVGSGSGFAQEPSAEAACIATLRGAVTRLQTIERQFGGMHEKCTANAEAAAQLPAARARIEALTKQNDALQTAEREQRQKAEELERQRADAARRLNEAERELAVAQERVSSLGRENMTLETDVGELRRNKLDLERQLSSANANLGQARRDLDAANDRIKSLGDRSSALQSEVESLKRRTADQARQIASFHDRLKAGANEVAARIRAALGGPWAACERLEVTVDAEAVVQVAGQLLNAEEARRRLAQIAGPAPGVQVRDVLTKIDLCGQPIGDGWILETTDMGLRYVGNREIPPEVAARLPEGTDQACRTIGAMLDATRHPDLQQVRRSFWVIRPGTQAEPKPGYCETSGAEPWRYSESRINQVRALLVQRSR